MSLKCSLEYLQLDGANNMGIHVFREAGTNMHYLELSNDAICVPVKLAEDLAKVLKKHRGYDGYYNGCLKDDEFKVYYERKAYKAMLKKFFGAEKFKTLVKKTKKFANKIKK